MSRAERLDEIELHLRALARGGEDVALDIARLDGMRRTLRIPTNLKPDPVGRDAALDSAIDRVRGVKL